MLTDEEAMELMAEDMSIDIPIKHESKPYLMIPLPNNATNGDMIKIMFPHIRVNEYINSIDVVGLDGMSVFSKEWWYAPYKKENKNEESNN